MSRLSWQMAAAASAAAAAAVLVARNWEALVQLWEGDAALQHGVETLRIVSANLGALRRRLDAARAELPPPQRRAAAVGVIVDGERCVEDLDLCLLPSDARESAAWVHARAEKKRRLADAQALLAEAEVLLGPAVLPTTREADARR